MLLYYFRFKLFELFFLGEGVWYQESVAAVSTGDSGPGWLGIRTGWTRMNWTQINYPLTVKRETNID